MGNRQDSTPDVLLPRGCDNGTTADTSQERTGTGTDNLHARADRLRVRRPDVEVLREGVWLPDLRGTAGALGESDGHPPTREPPLRPGGDAGGVVSESPLMLCGRNSSGPATFVR